MSDIEPNALVSVEDAQGRILSGVGVSEDSLSETMDRHTPDEPATPPAEASPHPEVPRNDQGQFAKPARGQKRFDQLTGEREAEKRAREAAERERDEYKAKLEQFRGAPAVRAADVEVQPPTAAKPPAPQKYSKTFDQFVAETPDATYEDYIDARAEWLYQQRIQTLDLDAQIRSSIEADRASRSRSERLTQAVERGRTTYQDFDAVLQRPHMTANNWDADKIQAIANLEAPEQIQYQLGQNPDLAERLRTADPVTFGMELGKLMTSTAVAPVPASTARTVAHLPPAPYQPVAGGGSTTVPSSAQRATASDYDFDKSGYREARARERGVRVVR